MKKELTRCLMIIMLFLICIPTSVMALQDTIVTTTPMVEEKKPGTVTVSDAPEDVATVTSFVNPLTGIETTDIESLAIPPLLIPFARFPSGFRPSSGLSSAAWVYEMSEGAGGESKPIGIFYGEMPVSNKGADVQMVGHLSSALLGVESLRKQYSGFMITTRNDSVIEDAGLHNVEYWYGVTGAEIYPYLPIENLMRIIKKWDRLLPSVDVDNIALKFSNGAPQNGKLAQSVYMRYAKQNQILWEYDAISGNYRRSQNSNENLKLTADADALNGKQIAVENLIILFTQHKIVNNGAGFTVNFNFIDALPALLFRDGRIYEIEWTTKSEEYELHSQRLRPIRLIDGDRNPVPLKPGHTWVHVVNQGNPYYEIEGITGTTMAKGSGHWKIPYISVKTNGFFEYLAENPELSEYQK